MNSATQDAIEALRQLQKLSKELQPVKAALAALLKREQASPNPLAAADSLEKVAVRVAAVSDKYNSFFDRISFLLGCELPRLQRVTPLLATEEGNKNDTALNGHAKTKGNDVTTHDAFLYVCSPTVPHILRRENYNMVRRMLHLRMEIVDYLIATGRYQIALHVLDAYGLPLFCFPKLLQIVLPSLPPIQSGNNNNNGINNNNINNNVNGVKNRNSLSGFAENPGATKLASQYALLFGTPYLPFLKKDELQAPQSALTPEQISINCIEKNHSVIEAIAYCEERLRPAIKRIDTVWRQNMLKKLDDLLVDLHATRLLQMFVDEKTDQKNVLTYISTHFLRCVSRKPSFVQKIIDAVTLSDDPRLISAYIAEPATHSSGGNNFISTGLNASADAAKSLDESMQLVAHLMSAEGYHRLAVAFHHVAILVGSHIFLIAEQLALRQERRIGDEGEGKETSPSPHILPDLVSRVVVASVLLKDEYLDRMVLQRRADVCPTASASFNGHLNTQSGSAAFDQSIISVIEEIMSHMFAESSQNKNVAVAVPFTPAELLEAEDIWSNDVLFIRRPTRFYCHLTKKCFDGGTGANCPVAFPNGTVVSRLALLQSSIGMIGDGEEQLQNSVVCPRTNEDFPSSSLRRIFVT